MAIKIIKRERLHSEDNFKEELKVARKLQHPNIVLLHASYQDNRWRFLVSEPTEVTHESERWYL